MKRKLLWAVKLICVLVLVGVCIGLLQEYVFCHADHNRQRLKGFYLEDKDSLDVVYLGASEVYSDIAPGYAYQRDGITSYLFASQANTIFNYKSQLKNILSRQKDALVVIELNGAMYDEEDLTNEASLHNYGDNVPLDFTKLEWAAAYGGQNTLELLFPYIKYHTTWSDTEDHSKDELYRKTISDDKKRGYNYLKGMLNVPLEFPLKVLKKYDEQLQHTQETEPLNDRAEKALRELLSYCKDKELTNVAFVRFPVVAVEGKNDTRYKRINTAAEIVEEYGYDLVNFAPDFDTQIGLDPDKDFYNEEHLNVHGQQKFTAFLTDWLKEHYGLTSHELTDKQRREWDVCSDYYNAYVKYNEAMLAERDFSEISENSELIEKLSVYIPGEGANRVSLTVDSKTEKFGTNAATVKELLEEQNIVVDADDEMNVRPDDAVFDGMEITVLHVEYKNVIEHEPIPYITKETVSDLLPEGATEITREGVDGEMEVTYRVKYINDKEIFREKIAEKRTKGAVPQIITKGTGTAA